jgi:hypothetical protein
MIINYEKLFVTDNYQKIMLPFYIAVSIFYNFNKNLAMLRTQTVIILFFQ